MGSGGSKKTEDVKNSNQNKSVTNRNGVQENDTPQHRHQTDNNNVSKTNSNVNSRKRHNADESDDDNLDDLDLDSDWRGNKNTTVNIKTTRDTDRKTKEMNEYNRQKNAEINRQQRHEDHYPETYAQRNLREMYTQNNMLRQKTIYRDPDAWQAVKQEDTGNAFDVSKFKQANKPTQVQRDIFGDLPEYALRNQIEDGDLGLYHTGEEKTNKRIVPEYDITEEELMADIDKEFND